MNTVNVINKAENELNVTVNSIDGNIQIIIDKKKEKIDLLTLKEGDIFEINNVKYIVLEQLSGNQTAILRKELLEDIMEFDSDNNNWKTSSIRRFLNGEYLNEIEKIFGRNRIVKHSVDLLSLDGLEDYGTSIDDISLLTVNEYRKYRKILGSNLDNWWWLITPDSTPSGCSARDVQCVRSDGRVGCRGCVFDGGVRPFFIIQS